MTIHELFVAKKVQATCAAQFQADKFAPAASAANSIRHAYLRRRRLQWSLEFHNIPTLARDADLF